MDGQQLPWKERCAKKKAEVDARIPRTWLLEPSIVRQAKSARKISGPFIESLLDEWVRDITRMSSVELVDDLRAGSLTAHEVTEAFCKRAAVAHQIVIQGFHISDESEIDEIIGKLST